MDQPPPAPPPPAIICDTVWHDAARDRDLPVRIRMPAGAAPVPLVLFSPGLGGTTSGGAAWGEAWAAAGFAVIHLQHPGSDADVYLGAASPADVPARVRAAASAPQLVARIRDVRFVLDAALRRPVVPGPGTTGCDLGRIDPARIAMAGHSMGAWTAAAEAGQRYPGGLGEADARIKAVVLFSPSPQHGVDPAYSFGAITIPVLSITGTEDGQPLSADPDQRASALADRTAAYQGLPAGGKYQLIFDGADHMIFSGGTKRLPHASDAHVTEIAALATTAFWQATLNGDARARAFLATPEGLRARLNAADSFETK